MECNVREVLALTDEVPDAPPVGAYETEMVPVDDIRVPETYSYAVHSEEKQKQLIQSIVKQGIIVPLKIVKVDGELCLADGFNRWQIARHLGLTHVPCNIQEGTSKDLRLQNLTLNKNRGKYDPIGNCRVLKALIEEDGVRVEEAAEAIGISASYARRLLSLQRLPPSVQEDIRQGDLSASHGLTLLIYKQPEHLEQLRELHRLTEEQAQAAADEQILDLADFCKLNAWTVEALEVQVRGRLGLALTPQQEQIAFTETGAVVSKQLTCEFCGKDTEGGAVYAWFHQPCLNDLRLLIKHIDEGPPAPPAAETAQPPFVDPSQTYSPQVPGHYQIQPPPRKAYPVVCSQCGAQMLSYPLGDRCPQCGMWNPH